MNFEILSTESDAGKLTAAAELLCEHLSVDGGRLSIEEVEGTLRAALAPGRQTRLALAFEDEIPVGVCFSNLCVGVESGGDYLWVNEMFIRPESRSQGAGRELFEFVLEMAREAGCRRIVAWTGRSNKRSQRFFSENGFELSDVVALERSLLDT